MRANLAVISPNVGCFGPYHVIRNFAITMVDATRRRNGADIIDWEIEGKEHLDELMSSEGGAVLLTAHMGNYDLAAQLFAGKFSRKIHAVRAPERNAETQEVREAQLLRGQAENLEIRYNKPGEMLGIELMNAVSAGEIVALQGDRVLFEVADFDTAFSEGHRIKLPKGPFVLSAASRCQIYPVFIARTGFRRYRLIARKPFSCRRVRGTGQEGAMKAAAEDWLVELRPILERYWAQWYVFENVFTPLKESE